MNPRHRSVRTFIKAFVLMFYRRAIDMIMHTLLSIIKHLFLQQIYEKLYNVSHSLGDSVLLHGV